MMKTSSHQSCTTGSATKAPGAQRDRRVIAPVRASLVEGTGQDVLRDAHISRNGRPALLRQRVEEFAVLLGEGAEAGMGRGCHKIERLLFLRSVTSIAPGACVMANGGLAAAITA